MITIAIANQKGGVGKTTLARNLAFHSIERGLRTLCVDLDPQKNFTKTLLAQRAQHAELSLPTDAMSASQLFQPVVSGADSGVRPLACGGNAALIAADRELVDVAALPLEALTLPRKWLESLAGAFDLCLIDTAPTLGNPLYAALIAADYFLCPCTVDQDATDGLADLFEDIARVQQLGWNTELKLLGVLANCVNTRRVYDQVGLQSLREGLGELLIDSVLYERAATKVAKDRPVWRSQRGESHARAAQEMKAVCDQIFRRTALQGV